MSVIRDAVRRDASRARAPRATATRSRALKEALRRMSRADRVAGRLAERELDVLLVTDLVNLRYLTGFTGSNGMAVVGRGRAPLRHRLPLRRAGGAARSPDFERERARRTSLDGARRAAGPTARCALGFEDEHMRCRPHARLREVLPDRVELVGGRRRRRGQRAVKEPDEVATIRAAARRSPTSVCELAARAGARRGAREREVALALEQRDAPPRRAASRASPRSSPRAPHGALPHAAPRDEEIERGTLVTLDMGRAARRLLLGLHPHVRHRRARRRRSPRSTSSCCARSWPRWTRCGPAPTGREVDAVARELIDDAGHGEHFGHGLGHGVGMEVHEAPRLRAHRQGRARRRATSSPSSRASTCPAWAACGSRTSWSSPRTAATCSAGTPKELIVVD